MKKKITRCACWILPILFVALFIYGRIRCYGPMNDSVAAHDTESYFTAAEASFPSLEFFEQMRSATVPLFYRIINPTLEHELTLISEPYFQTEPELAIQPGTERIIRAQTILSIVCWALFVLSICSSLKHWLPKAAAALILCAFAFVPQVADWDSILLSESLSFSLFALMLALLLKIIPNGKPKRISDWFWCVLFLISAALWVFTRDTNSYFLLLTAILLTLTGILWWVVRGQMTIPLLITSFLLIGLFIFQQKTFNMSERWMLPFLNNMTTNVFPYPERVEYFESEGMPVDAELLKQTGSAEYNEIYEQELFMKWARRFGLETYQKFLLTNPFWTVLQVTNNLDVFFEENIQPFFYGQEDEKPRWAESVGNLLHPLSAGVILIDLLLFCTLTGLAIHGGNDETKRWLVFCGILFIGGGVMMAFSYLGEVRSIWRHVLSGVLSLRLGLWVMLIAIWDQNIIQRREDE